MIVAVIIGLILAAVVLFVLEYLGLPRLLAVLLAALTFVLCVAGSGGWVG